MDVCEAACPRERASVMCRTRGHVSDREPQAPLATHTTRTARWAESLWEASIVPRHSMVALGGTSGARKSTPACPLGVRRRKMAR